MGVLGVAARASRQKDPEEPWPPHPLSMTLGASGGRGRPAGGWGSGREGTAVWRGSLSWASAEGCAGMEARGA